MKIPHRSWLVCLGGSLALIASIGLGINVFSVYQPAIIALNDFTNAQGSMITTIRSLFGIFSMLMVGRIVGRIDLRATMGIGMVSAVLSCLIFSVASSFPIYCVGGALAGISYALAGMIPLSIAITRWFHVRRGYALGLAGAGSGIPTIIAPPIINESIHANGLAPTFFWEAMVMLILTILVVALVRNSPEEMGLTPFGGENDTSVDVSSSKESSVSTPVWAVLLVATFLVGAPTGTGFSHLTVLFTSEGFSDETVTLLLSYLGLVLMISKTLCGQINDILGGYRANYIFYGVLTVGFLACCLAPTGSLFIAFFAITTVALGFPISSISFSVWASDLSSSAQYPKRVQQVNIAYMVGNMTFGPTPGILADITGSYVPAYAVFAGAGVISMVMIQTIYLQFNRSLVVK